MQEISNPTVVLLYWAFFMNYLDISESCVDQYRFMKRQEEYARCIPTESFELFAVILYSVLYI